MWVLTFQRKLKFRIQRLFQIYSSAAPAHHHL